MQALSWEYLAGMQVRFCLHSGQTHDACAVHAIILQRKRQTTVGSFTLTAKLNAVSENLSFYVENVFKIK